MLVLIFTLSMFLGAGLLFLVEPMIAKMLLPMLGGTPAVWNTCLVFFQAMLLAGYLYAHASIKWLGRRSQIAFHTALVLLPVSLVGLLPLHLPSTWIPPALSTPVFWIFGVLLVSVGLPFFVLSSTTPIMQKWFAACGHPQASDPYFLYAASNAGSLTGLLAYPLLFEPLLGLTNQSRDWTIGYLLFIVLVIVCAVIAWRQTKQHRSFASDASETPSPLSWPQRLNWIALAFVPSSLMLGVTTALTTDVPAIPLLWVLSLAFYLVSFILVFARRPPISHEWMIGREPFLLLAGLVPTVSQSKLPFAAQILLYLAVLFGVAMVCHGELARTRPPVGQLTEFYLWVSVGGVLGGLFNSLLAPVIFRSVLELPLVLIFAAWLRPVAPSASLTGDAAIWAKRKDWLLPLCLCVSMLAVIFGLSRTGIKPSRPLNIIFFGYSLLWCLSFSKRRLRFVAGLAVVVFASSFYPGTFGHVIRIDRSFFGVSRVTTDPKSEFRFLFHGGTIHGMQNLKPAQSREPLTYYSSTGPAGQIVRAAQSRMPQGDWAIVGLGAGSMACYLQSGQTLTYYEIDPLVERIAEDPRYFSFLSQCAPQAKIVLGDARIRLREAPDSHYGLIVLDAFSGDSIPMHLVTRQALALYQRKLAPHGLLAFHISNLYVKLAPQLANLAADAHLACLVEEDTKISQAEIDAGKFPSIWVVMARDASDFAALTSDPVSGARWTALQPRPGARVWTDDYSNLLSAIKWN